MYHGPGEKEMPWRRVSRVYTSRLLCTISPMARFCRCAAVLLAALLSCARAEKGPADPAQPEPSVQPATVVRAGEYPLWFQFTGEGQAVIETIEDARFSAALIPWPLAPHVRFALAQGEEFLMAVNRGGLIRLSPWDGEGGIGLYHYPGGEFWRGYTVGAFVLLGENPVALLYRDDRFLETGDPLPSPRLWTFGQYSPKPEFFALPALDAFAPEDGWDIDALRRGADGFWYYRAVRKNAGQPQTAMLRSGDLAGEGERVSLGAFQAAALPEPLAAAPEPLGELLAALFAGSDCRAALVVSPGFHGSRGFALSRESPAAFGFYSPGQDSAGAFLLTAFPRGDAVLVERGIGTDSALRRFALPPLPEGFAYTGIGMVAGTVVATWEEQDGYSIGAAGFMVIRGVGNRE